MSSGVKPPAGFLKHARRGGVRIEVDEQHIYLTLTPARGPGATTQMTAEQAGGLAAGLLDAIDQLAAGKQT